MATLYQTTNTARKVIIFFLIGAVIILVIDLFQRAPVAVPANAELKRFYMVVDGKLGNIAAPTIPAINVNKQGATYALEGVYGVFPDVAYLYSVEKPREKLLVFENAQKNTVLLGFSADAFEDKGDESYTWNSVDLTKRVDFNKTLQSWKLTTEYEGNVDAIRRKALTREIEYYLNQTERLVNLMSFDNYGMDNAIYNAKYAKLDNGIFVEKTNAVESDYIIVNAYRNLRLADLKPRNELPEVKSQALIPKVVDGQVYGNDPRIGQMHGIASENFSNYAKELYEMSFTNFEYSSKKGSYSLVTPDEAWNKIQSGGGSIVSILPQNFNYFAEYPTNLSVRRFTADRSKTVLGYYEPEEWIGFVYPIYIFEGRAELTDGRIGSFILFIDAQRR